MKRKGVSPVIATVLLIGMVVVLGLIIFLWMRSLAQETITKFEGENIELACNKVEFEASKAGGQLTISNGNVPMYDISVKISVAGGFHSEKGRDLFDNWPSSGLNSGGIFSGTPNQDLSGKIVVTPILLGKSDTGSQRTFTCNEKNHGREVF